MNQMKERNNRKCSGQILVITVLVVSLVLLSTQLYIYEVGRSLEKTESTSNNDFIFAVKLGSRHAIIGSLANISTGGNNTILFMNLERWTNFVDSLYQHGKPILNFTLEKTLPYTNGTYLSWGNEGFGISSASADFNFSLKDTQIAVKLPYAINITTSLEVEGFYQTLQGNYKQVNVTCNLFNEESLALAKNLTLLYENGSSWLQADEQSYYIFTDYGNGTYFISFLAAIPQENVNVSVKAYDLRGIYVQANATCTNEGFKTTLINIPPVAAFTESQETVYTGELVKFNASNSYDPDGSIVSYFWNYGDDSNATGQIVNHGYADDGNYTLVLTVTDDDNATDSTTAVKTVLNRNPVATFIESSETVYVNEIITLNASSSYDADGSIINYFWDFGDGINTTNVVVDHSYAQDGNYTVKLTVTDNDGATASATATKTVLNMPPVASFTESAETVYTDVSITFNGSDSYDPDGVIAEYLWDFGDGTNATGVIATHSYLNDGNYTVTLTVKDDKDSSSSSTTTKTVLNPPSIVLATESLEPVYAYEIAHLKNNFVQTREGRLLRISEYSGL
jgi:PKD repeat protein